MTEQAAPIIGSRDSTMVTGYATSETEDYLPRAVTCARTVARALESRRTHDPDWFWFGSDYLVSVDTSARESLIIIAAECLDEQPVERVRAMITNVVQELFHNGQIKVFIDGKRHGLKTRIGSSGRLGSLDQYGSRIPCAFSGVGFHLRHPSNIGAFFARKVARELVLAGAGKAVLAQAVWLPYEAMPQSIIVRNERGERLTVSADQFDISKAPDAFCAANLASAVLRAPFDGSVILPWE